MSNIIRSTTGLALHLVQPYIGSAAIVIDATCGNGHDTLALAKAMTEASQRHGDCSFNRQDGSSCRGRLLAFDVQPEAIMATGQILNKNGFRYTGPSCDIPRYQPEIALIHDSHENIDSYSDTADVVVFNLGYLPGGNKEFTTTTGSTLTAIRKALDILKKDGVLCITMYSGHDAGAAEKKALLDFSAELDSSRFHAAYVSMLNQHNNPPEILLITKK